MVSGQIPSPHPRRAKPHLIELKALAAAIEASPANRRLFLSVTFLLAAALPARGLEQSLWSDEANSIWFARLPLATLLTTLCDPHPAGYYLLLKIWLVAGESEFWLRLPSLLAAVLAIALTYRLGVQAYGPAGGRLAALLVALHPLQTWYAGEARPYMLVQCLGLLLLWLGWRLLRAVAAPSIPWRQGVAYGLTAQVALGSDYTALLPLAIVQLFWLLHGRPSPRRWWSLQAVVLSLAAFLWLNPSQILALQRSYHAVFIAIQANHLGLDLSPATGSRLWPLTLLGFASAGVIMAWYWPHWLKSRLDQPLVQLGLVAGWLALLLFAVLPRAFTVKRQMIVLLPYLALLTSYSLARLPRPAKVLSAGLGLGVTLLVLPLHPREPWQTVVTDLIRQKTGQTEVIWVDELSVPAFNYYLEQSPADAAQVLWTPLFGRSLPQLPNLTPQPGHTLWLVTAETPHRHLVRLLPPNFYRHYQLLEQHHERGIGLYRYRRSARPAYKQPEVAPPTLLDKWGLLLPSPLDTCQPR